MIRSSCWFQICMYFCCTMLLAGEIFKNVNHHNLTFELITAQETFWDFYGQEHLKVKLLTFLKSARPHDHLDTHKPHIKDNKFYPFWQGGVNFNSPRGGIKHFFWQKIVLFCIYILPKAQWGQRKLFERNSEKRDGLIRVGVGGILVYWQLPTSGKSAATNFTSIPQYSTWLTF